MAFSVIGSELFSSGGLRLVADFNQSIQASTVQTADLVVDGSRTATSINVVDADTVEFYLPALAAGTHSVLIAAAAILDATGTGLTAFSKSFSVASASQYSVKHNPRLQPGNAPLVGYAGSELDRVDILWQTIPAGTGTQDSFTVDYRPVGATTWTRTSLNAAIDTGVEGRVVRSVSVTGLNWNSNYEYLVRHRRADIIVGQYQSSFRTRLAAGNDTSYTFVAYGDSANGEATGFRQVQGRINQLNPAFAVLLGDNVYEVGTHQELDSRFDPLINPEAAAWMAGHIDYPAMGNHDVSTSSGLPSEQDFSVPIPIAGVTAPAAPPAGERAEHNFSWDYGNVHFVTFDTNSYSDPSRLDRLLNWVVADLNASTARWKIVYGHHPIGGGPDKPEGPSDNYYQQVVSRLKTAGVDLFMTGHSHTFSWTYPLTGQTNGSATYVDHGVDDYFRTGEGLQQLICGIGGNEIQPGGYSQFPFIAEGYSATTPTPARFGFAKIDVTPSKLTVSYVAADNGAVIDSFQIEKEATQTVSFQHGSSGYTGAVDTFLQQGSPDLNNATATSLKIDGDSPDATGFDTQALLRFDNLFGSGAGQIPLNATLRSATLQLQVTNDSVDSLSLHRMLASWSAADTWNTLSGGVQTNGVEAVGAPDAASGQSAVGQLSINVLASLQAWQANPASNRGWAIIPTGDDGVDFNSCEGVIKPRLIVRYVVPSGTNDPPVAADDPAVTEGSTPVTVSVLGNDRDVNGDLLTIQSATQPSHGVTSISASSITYTPAAGYYGTDSFSYTINDGRGGTATATVNVSIVQTTTFQQGIGGYTSAVDTFLQQNSPDNSNGTAVSIKVDSDDPDGTGLDTQALLRFDSIFGAGPGQIPTNATLRSATLQLQVTNGSAYSMNVNRMLTPWSATSTWNTLSGGVQPDNVEALATPDVSTGPPQVGTLSINVLASLQAWQANPTANRGWVIIPTGNDGVDFDSAEGAFKPKLIVGYIPAPAANNPPVAVNDAAVTHGNTQVTVPVLANDSDPNSDMLTVQSATQPAHGVTSISSNSVTYTPAAGYAGTDSFSYTISDGRGGTSTATVTVSIIQTASFQQGAGGYTGTVDTFLQQNSPDNTNDTAASLKVDSDDPDGTGLDTQALLRFDNLFGNGPGQIPLDATLRSATLQLQITNDSAFAMNLHRMLSAWFTASTWNTLAGGVQVNGVEAATAPDASSGAPPVGPLSINVLTSLQAWQANPAANRGWAIVPTGNDGIDFHSSEGATRPKLTVTFIPSDNKPPSLSDIANRTINEDVSTGPLAFSINDAETAATSLTVAASSSNTTIIPNASLVLSGSGSNRTLTVTPAANRFGSAVITVSVTDGNGATAVDTFSLTVNPVNDAPVAANDSAGTAGTIPVTVPVLANDGDVENNPLTVNLASLPTKGVAVVNSNGTVTYTANTNSTGTDSFTYRASDGAALSNVGTVTVTLAASPKFFVVDSTSDKTFGYQGNGGSLTQTMLGAGNANARGVAAKADGSRLWVLDSNRIVYIYDASLKLIGSWTAGGLNVPTGISVSGSDVWIVDDGNDRAYLYAAAMSRLSGSQNPTRSFSLNSGNLNPTDLVTNGVSLWITNDAATNKVFKYTAAGSLLGSWTVDVANATPTGITIDPANVSNIWIVDSGTDRVYQYNAAASRISGTQAAAVVFALASGNTDPQGIADPPPYGSALQVDDLSLRDVALLSLVAEMDQILTTQKRRRTWAW